METILALLTVFVLGMIELWAAIPAGLVMQLDPLAVGLAAAIGAMAGVLLVVFMGKPIRAWLVRRHDGSGKEGAHGRIHRIWERHGPAGLGLLAPLLVGAPLGAALGIAFGAPTRPLLCWMGVGIVGWSVVITLAGALGWAGIKSLAQ
jgi:hypothetical protein